MVLPFEVKNSKQVQKAPALKVVVTLYEDGSVHADYPFDKKQESLIALGKAVVGIAGHFSEASVVLAKEMPRAPRPAPE